MARIRYLYGSKVPLEEIEPPDEMELKEVGLLITAGAGLVPVARRTRAVASITHLIPRRSNDSSTSDGLA